MYAMSLSSALFLFEKPAAAVAVAASGVILGWPFSILAFLPVTIYSLVRKFKRAFLSGVVTSIAVVVSYFLSICTPTKTINTIPLCVSTSFIGLMHLSTIFQALSVFVDNLYYGKWTSSVLNLLIYNVLGGGESHLYGTEGASFYFRNGFNNFNFCFILALLFVVILPFAKKKYAPELLVIVSPIYIWLAFMSLQPHKEER